MEAIEQALYGVAPLKGYGFLANSTGFLEPWKVAAEQLCTHYGERPAGITFTGALFALPLVSGRIAIVEVRDQGTDDQGRPGALEFRILAVPVSLYRDLGGDPFWIAAQWPPDWAARGALPSLQIQSTPPERTTATLRPVLQRADSPVLLGATQGLLDGSRLQLIRTAPAPDLVRGLWQLLPTRSRESMWPCTYSFRARPEFHVQVVPPTQPMLPYMLTEEQAADYPEGRYELSLQTAVENQDEAELYRLLQRSSRQQMLWLALALLALFLIVPVGSALMPRPQPQPRPPHQPTTPPGLIDQTPDPEPNGGEPRPRQPQQRSSLPLDRPTFPVTEIAPALLEAERQALATRLRDLAARHGFRLPGGDRPGELTLQLEALDEQLPTTERGRLLKREAAERFLPRLLALLAGDPHGRLLNASLTIVTGGAGQLRDHGPIERQVRVLLWKQGVVEYRRQGPNACELLDLLEERLR